MEKIENGQTNTPSALTIKEFFGWLMENAGEKRRISLILWDPTASSCFPITPIVVDSVVDSIRSHKFNGYAPAAGLPQTRTAIADYLSCNLPYKLMAEDVYVTTGCKQAIELALSILSRPGANILVPRPGFLVYELCASFRHIETRHYDLLPDKGWEVNPKAVENLADHKTVAMVIINPGNPCGNVYSYEHLMKIAETAKMFNIPVIADEVYENLAFGDNPFAPMAIFGFTVPVITLSSLSKRWMVPGWRLGWLVTCDPNGVFKG